MESWTPWRDPAIEEREDDVFEGDSESGRSVGHHTPFPPAVPVPAPARAGRGYLRSEFHASDGSSSSQNDTIPGIILLSL